MREQGVTRVRTYFQGVDPLLFSPFVRAGHRAVARPEFSGGGARATVTAAGSAAGDAAEEEPFVIFSGGKLEYRKGQDIVVAAFRLFAAAHPAARLLVAWDNRYADALGTMTLSPHTVGAPSYYAHALDRPDVLSWLAANGVPRALVQDAGPLRREDVPAVLARADVALFTNRAEGGTNLVAMETVASGLPTVLSASTGHLDLLSVCGDGCIALRNQTVHTEVDALQTGGSGVLRYGWTDSDVGEVVAALEAVYADPSGARARAAAAAAAMQRDWPWSRHLAALAADMEAAGVLPRLSSAPASPRGDDRATTASSA